MQTQSHAVQYQTDGPERSAPRRLWSFAEVQKLLGGAHRTTLWRWWRSKAIPEPVRIGNGRKLFWYQDEIEAAIAGLARVGSGVE